MSQSGQAPPSRSGLKRPDADMPTAVGALARDVAGGRYPSNPSLVAFEDPVGELILEVAADRVVSIEYDLHDDTGELIETTGGEPLTYLHGHDNVVPGLEKALRGKRPGDGFEVVVEAEDGYGEVVMDELLKLPRSMFEDGIEVGDELVFEAEDGEESPIWVVAFEGDWVRVDLDHPLAGVRLHYQGRVVAVRDAAEVELEQGYPLDDEGDTGG